MKFFFFKQKPAYEISALFRCPVLRRDRRVLCVRHLRPAFSIETFISRAHLQVNLFFCQSIRDYSCNSWTSRVLARNLSPADERWHRHIGSEIPFPLVPLGPFFERLS